MTQHQTFLRFLSDVLARGEEPAEPVGPRCLSMTSQPSAERLPSGTCGTENLVGGRGSAAHAGTPHLCGTTEIVVHQTLQRPGSAVPQFRDYASSGEPKAGCFPSDEEERSAIALVEGQVPAIYAVAFAQLQVNRPPGPPEWMWRQAINDAGLFLDEWGRRAEHLGWAPDDLFSPPIEGQPCGGLVWRLQGRRVAAVLITGAVVYCSLRRPQDGDLVREEQGRTIVWLRGSTSGPHR